MKMKIFVFLYHTPDFLENPEAISDIFTLPQDFGPFSLRLRQQAPSSVFSFVALDVRNVLRHLRRVTYFISRQKIDHHFYFLHVKLEHNFSSFISFVATWFKSLDGVINIQSYCPSFGWSPSGPFNPKMYLINQLSMTNLKDTNLYL